MARGKYLSLEEARKQANYNTPARRLTAAPRPRIS